MNVPFFQSKLVELFDVAGVENRVVHSAGGQTCFVSGSSCCPVLYEVSQGETDIRERNLERVQ